MDDTKKMFQTIINGQSAMKSELLSKINGVSNRLDDVEKKLSGKIDGLDGKMNQMEKRLTARIDKLGLQIAKLEDDSPTVEEFDRLERRVTKVEQKVAAI